MAELLASWWVLGLVFSMFFAFGTGPMVLFYFAWRIHRNIARIADALESGAVPRSMQHEASTLAKRAPEHWPAHEVSTSMFGR
jgi:hypothetical protein